MAQENLSLFPSTQGDALVERLTGDFQRWRASSPGRGAGAQGALREESAQIYEDMWGAFIAYCAPVDLKTGERSVRVDPHSELSRAQLLEFLGHAAERPLRQIRTGQARSELSPRYAWRVLQLIDRVLNHAFKLEGLETYEAAHDLMQEEPYRYVNAASQIPVPDFLTDAQSDALIAHCTRHQCVDLAVGASWKVLRDRCAVGLMLGAGLAPGQVRMLRIDDVTIDGGREEGVPWRFSVAADGSTPAHQVPVASWAGRQLRFWLEVRSHIGIQIDQGWLFPSTTTGKPWSHPACHRSAVTVMEEVGIEGGSPFRLRHTFAVRQLSNGMSEEEVARWMGYADTGPMRRYRHVMARPAGDVV